MKRNAKDVKVPFVIIMEIFINSFIAPPIFFELYFASDVMIKLPMERIIALTPRMILFAISKIAKFALP